MNERKERLAAYYDTLDPGERKDLLDELEAAGDPLLNFRRILWQERYTDPKHPERRVDNYLWKCVYLPGLYRRRRMLRSPLKREIQKTLEELHLAEPEALSEAEAEALYLEFRNAARRYLGTCRSDRYGRTMLGLKKADDARKLEKACEDIWTMSRGVALAAKEEGRMRLWCDALYDEWLDYTPEAEVLYEKTEQTQGRKL